MSRLGGLWRVICSGNRVASLLLALVALFCLVAPLSAAELDFSKALKIGSGPKVVVEFTDPDCPFCRRASHYLDGRRDLTRYVFFYPLPRHPRAQEKVRHILSRRDGEAAYHQAMSGAMDNGPKLSSTPQGVLLQVEQLRIARKIGVTSTPTFMVNGRILTGFDQARLEELLGR